MINTKPHYAIAYFGFNERHVFTIIHDIFMYFSTSVTFCIFCLVMKIMKFVISQGYLMPLKSLMFQKQQQQSFQMSLLLAAYLCRPMHPG